MQRTWAIDAHAEALLPRHQVEGQVVVIEEVVILPLDRLCH